LGKMVQYSVADDSLCILQKGMRRAFGLQTWGRSVIECMTE
jgi:hypothetical protein